MTRNLAGTTVAVFAFASMLACSAAQHSPALQKHHAEAQNQTTKHVNAVTPKSRVHSTYPPFISEAQAKVDESTEVRRDLPLISRSLAPGVLVSFSATTSEGLPQFNYIVNQQAWDAVPQDTRKASVLPGGAIFKETNSVYRKYHRGRVCLGDSGNNLMLHVVNERGVEVGLDYTVFVAHSEC